MTTTTPQLDKLDAVSDQINAISSFLYDGRFVLCERRPTGRFSMASGEEEWGYVPVTVIKALLEHFEIDPDALEAERRQLLQDTKDLLATTNTEEP